MDLGQSFNVAWVNLFNRTDCCQNRLSDMYVCLLSDTPSGGAQLPPASKCQYISSGPQRVATVDFNRTGRYLRVQSDGKLPARNRAVSLAEVEVYATPAGTGATTTGVPGGNLAVQPALVRLSVSGDKQVGLAGTQLPGPVCVSLSGPACTNGSLGQQRTARVTAAKSGLPLIHIDGVAGAGSSTPPVTAISTNGYVSIYGSYFAPPGTLASGAAVKGMLGTTLAGTCVQIGGKLAPLSLVTPEQINALAPAVTGPNTTVQVIVNCRGGQRLGE